MRSQFAFAHGAAWLLAAALASCSHEQKAAPPPPPPAKPTAAQMSQKSFQAAQQTQNQLNDQVKKAEAAHQATATAQQNLVKAQQREDQEKARVLELQDKSNQQLEEGMKQAQAARAGLSGEQTEGLQTVAGTVSQATGSHIVLDTGTGRPVTFAVNDHTRVLIGDVQRGADAHVAFDPGAPGQPTALLIRIMPAGESKAAPSKAPSHAPAPAQ